MSIEAIKKALEGVSHAPGPWKAIRMSVYCNDTTGKRVADTRSEHHLWDDGQRQQLATYIAAVNPPAITALISEIDRLQRENASLLEDRYKLACAITGGEDAPGLLDSTPTSEIVEIAQHAHRMHQGDIDRAMAAEAEVVRLQTELALSKPLYSRRQIEARVKSLEEALKPFADLAPSYDPPEDDDDHKCWHAESTPTLGNLRRARTALASTGGEHHGN